MSVTFNVTELSPFYADDDNSRMNSLKEEEEDEEPIAPLLHQGPITRSMAKKLQGMVSKHINKLNMMEKFGSKEEALKNTNFMELGMLAEPLVHHGEESVQSLGTKVSVAHTISHSTCSKCVS